MKKCLHWRSHLLFVLLWASTGAHGYQGELHQQLTFLSAKQLSRCSDVAPLRNQQHTQLPGDRLSALDTRYVVRANVARAKSNIFARTFRWNYFDVSREGSETVIGVFDTRFNERFKNVSTRLLNAQQRRDRLEAFGEMLSYLQDVSTPSRVVPVFTGRWWAFSMQDRFDRYSIDVGRLEADSDALCNEVVDMLAQVADQDLASSLRNLLMQSGRRTLNAVEQTISGMPARWTVFWQPSEKNPGGDFGDYGAAGNNFGNRVDFRCATAEDPKMRCLLLQGDPLYQEFAYTRHRDALRTTMLAMLIVQQQVEF